MPRPTKDQIDAEVQALDRAIDRADPGAYGPLACAANALRQRMSPGQALTHYRGFPGLDAAIAAAEWAWGLREQQPSEAIE